VSDSYTLREGTAADIALVAAQRRTMFVDMGHTDAAALDRMTARFIPWVERRLADGTYRAWFVETGGHVVAGAGLWLKPVQPGLRGPAETAGYVLNVYTDPDHRGKSLARQLMAAIIDWCREAGLDVVELHASDQGRPIYESLGFAATNEMRLILNPEDRGG
jgi:GNAT superfamily N-acetyltransferase